MKTIKQETVEAIAEEFGLKINKDYKLYYRKDGDDELLVLDFTNSHSWTIEYTRDWGIRKLFKNYLESRKVLDIDYLLSKLKDLELVLLRNRDFIENEDLLDSLLELEANIEEAKEYIETSGYCDGCGKFIDDDELEFVTIDPSINEVQCLCGNCNR